MDGPFSSILVLLDSAPQALSNHISSGPFRTCGVVPKMAEVSRLSVSTPTTCFFNNSAMADPFSFILVLLDSALQNAYDYVVAEMFR
jgi:hypothetical protein